MNISILTVFPELFDSFWKTGIIRKAVDLGKLIYQVYYLRDFISGNNRTVDGRPFGGGCGMIMKIEPIAAAIESIKKTKPSARTVFLSPQGRKLDHGLANIFSSFDELIFICGRYEGIDERVIDRYVDYEVSIGDYILTGGELAVMVVVDAIVRLIPGVLNNPCSVCTDTFSSGLVKYPQYTRPRSFKGASIPEVLISGDHAAIDFWRLEMSLVKTLLKRKDLLISRELTLSETKILNKWRLDIEEIIQKQHIHCIDTSSSP